MSIGLMTAVWRLQVSSTQKLVLLALADHANDQGECFPSMAMLAGKTGLSDRAVRSAVRELEVMGYVSSSARPGTSAVYTITPERGSAPERASDRNEVPAPSERTSAPPRNVVPPTPERRADITVNEPSIEPSLNHQGGKRPGIAVELPEWLPAETWAMWDAHRRRVTPKAWTQAAADLTLRTLGKHRAAGHDPVALLEKAVENGWRGVWEPKGPAGKPAAKSKGERWMEQLNEARRDRNAITI